MKKIILLFIVTSLTLLYSQHNYSESVMQKKIYPMGKKIYKHKCNEIVVDNYSTMQTMQDDIKSQKLCKKLKEKHFEALSLYLWEAKRKSIQKEELPEIEVAMSEKCPVCGMFVYKYPRWAAQIFYKDKRYSFDGMKDLMKWYFEYKEGIQKILTKDYYSQKTIDATKAYYVSNSDVYGPMGNELIAFKTKKEAKNFYLDHRGSKILHFSEITKKEVYKLDK